MFSPATALKEAIDEATFNSKEAVLEKVVNLGFVDQFTNKTPEWRDTDTTEVSEAGTVLWVHMPESLAAEMIAVDFDSKQVEWC